MRSDQAFEEQRTWASSCMIPGLKQDNAFFDEPAALPEKYTRMCWKFYNICYHVFFVSFVLGQSKGANSAV